jgi:hypothetical protein
VTAVRLANPYVTLWANAAMVGAGIALVLRDSTAARVVGGCLLGVGGVSSAMAIKNYATEPHELHYTLRPTAPASAASP